MEKRKCVKFKNGAVLLYEKDKRNNYSSALIGFRTGSFNNTQNGITHFLEHILFSGTKNKTRDDIKEVKAEIVPSLNAFTGENFCMTKFKRTNKMFEKACELASELLTENNIEEKNIETERKVILEEFKMYNDKAKRNIGYQHMFSYASNALTHQNCLGDETDLNLITKEKLEEYRDSHFVENSFLVSYVGNWSLGKVKRLIKKQFFAKLNHKGAYSPEYIQLKIDKEPNMQICKNDDAQISCAISFKYCVPEFERKSFYKDTILMSYLRNNKNSLYHTLRDKGLIYTASFDCDTMGTDALFNISFMTSKDKVQKVIKEVKSAIAHVATVPLSEQDLQTIKDNMVYNRDEIVGNSKDDKCVHNMYNYFDIGGGKKFINIEKSQLMKKLKNITATDIMHFAYDLFNTKNPPYVTFMGNLTQEDVPTYAEICKAPVQKKEAKKEGKND